MSLIYIFDIKMDSIHAGKRYIHVKLLVHQFIKGHVDVTIKYHWEFNDSSPLNHQGCEARIPGNQVKAIAPGARVHQQ